MKLRLDQAVEDFLQFCRANRQSSETIRLRRSLLRRLLKVCGMNIYVSDLGDEHLNNYLDEMEKTRPDSMLSVFSAVKVFLDWAVTRGYMEAAKNPMNGRKAPARARLQHRYLDPGDYPRMLASATHPRDRALYALGWNLCSRASEIRPIRIGELDRKQGKILIHVKKKRGVYQDWMTVGPELAEELDRWLRFYSDWAMRERGLPLDPSWFLVPAKEKPCGVLRDGGTGRLLGRQPLLLEVALKPTTQIGKVENVIRRGLTSVGWPTHDPVTEKVIRMGEHDLRRSGARFLYETLVGRGIPNAIQIVQALLHHETEQQTREYIGVDADTEYRDSVLSDLRLYDDEFGKVVDLGVVRDAAREADGTGM